MVIRREWQIVVHVLPVPSRLLDCTDGNIHDAWSLDVHVLNIVEGVRIDVNAVWRAAIFVAVRFECVEGAG